MTVYDIKELDKWATKTEKRMDYTVAQSLNDMLSDIKIVPGINRGGSRQDGTIPRDWGILANSQTAELFGSSSMTAVGSDSYISIVGAIGIGDKARFSWGGDNAPYAAPVHYGARGVQGTFWRDRAVAKYDSYVESTIERGKRAYP